MPVCFINFKNIQTLPLFSGSVREHLSDLTPPFARCIIRAWVLPAGAEVGESTTDPLFHVHPCPAHPGTTRKTQPVFFLAFSRHFEPALEACLATPPRNPHLVPIGPSYIPLVCVWHHRDQTWSRGSSYFCR